MGVSDISLRPGTSYSISDSSLARPGRRGRKGVGAVGPYTGYTRGVFRWRVVILSSVILAVSFAHYLTPTHAHGYHAFYRWFYHLPIILAAFWFGLRGGLAAAGAVTGLYLPHVIFQWNGGHPDQWMEIVLYILVGIVTGVLSQMQRDSFDALSRKARVLLETEEQLRIADRMAALGDLSAGLAHEIKTPLASIRGAAEILAAEESGPSEREEFSAILIREVDRLNRVVVRFLDFARPGEAGPEAADLRAAAEEILDLVRVESERRGVEIRSGLAPDLPSVRVDSEQLRQVILNLVMNALQAMEGGGTLDVTAHPVGRSVVLAVSDTGEGISESVRARIFDPFFTTRAKGTGLGLSIVMKIASNHGAEIAIRDREGGGTVFEVRFPAEEVEDEA